MKPQAIVTIVSNNYLHYARTLMESVARHHPEAARYCVIVDTDSAPALALAAEFEAIPLSALGLPFGDEFTFQYTILELNTAVKPWALELLFERGHSQVLYIDPDIYLYRPLSEVLALLDGGASVVLTPHLLAPVDDERNPGELAIRVAGTYNLGFCALSNHPAARQFLRWWQGKLARHCVVDKLSGIFVDQSWVDLAPGLFDDVAVLRHPGYNIAYWNLAQRQVTGDAEGGWLVNGAPLAFFHYSGIDPQKPQAVSKHQDRFRLDNLAAPARTLMLEYCRNVLGHGQAGYSKLPYGYATFADGTPISVYVRAQFRLSATIRAMAAGRPFDCLALADSRTFSGPARLGEIYQYFLNRPADAAALRDFSPRCTSWPGYLRTALGVARSAESRGKPGWLARLAFFPLRAVGMPLQESLTSALAMPAEAGAPLRAGGINLVGYIAAELGVGEAARSLARACSAAGVPYSVVDVGFQSSNLQRDTVALANASSERFAIDLVYVNADQTPNTIEYLRSKKLESAYKIGFWHWEQPSLPEAHLGAFDLLHEVWVPSNFVRDAVAAVSPLPVVVIPHALQFEASPGVRRSAFGLPEDKLLALVMYDFHSYQYRKNPAAAIAAFRQAQAGRSDAALVVKTINGEHHPEARAELLAQLSDLPGTVVIDRFLTRQQVWDLQSCCDLLVSLHRAEGFGLAPAEMMYLGKPVVATGWSANMDFMTHDNSMPVRYTLKPLAETLGAYPAGPLWAEADIDHAASCIARLLDDAGLRERMGQRAMDDVRRQLDPAVVGKLVAERLKAVRRWHPELA
ncbi:MAG: glycosyltransferase [Pseudomonadota bacterium]